VIPNWACFGSKPIIYRDICKKLIPSHKILKFRIFQTECRI
jgi:hypothetical protein